MKEITYINNKYQLDATNKDWIGFPVSFKNLPEEVTVQGEKFYFPTPFHVSLVYIGKMIEKYNISIPNFKDKTIEDFSEFTKANDISIVRYNEFRLVARDDKKAILVMCEVSNLNNFFDLINKKYGLKIKYMTTHVTLYNKVKGGKGIWLMDEEDIKKLTVPIENPISHTLELITK